MKDTEKRKSQVPEQLDRLSSEVGELEKIVDMLRDRLQPVLRNESGVVASQKDEEESLVNVANSIRVDVLRISGVVEIVGSMVNLLEL